MRSDGLSYFALGLNPRKVSLIREHLSGESVVDIGCGSGGYGEVLEEGFSRILQVDLEDRRLEGNRRFPFQAVDLNVQLPDWGKDAFSAALVFDVMEHLDDDRAFLLWLKNCVKGRIAMSVPHDDPHGPLSRVHLSHVHYVDKTHRREYGRDGLRALLESTGFRVVSLSPQFNDRWIHLPSEAAGTSRIGSALARLSTLWMAVLLRTGIVKNPIVSDWFVVFERIES